jgi:hypothetical protein
VPRCLEGTTLTFKTGLLTKRGYHTGSTTVGGPCIEGYTRSSAKVKEIFPTFMSCGGFNSIGPLTSVWASDNESDCRLKIEYDIHRERNIQASCQYLIHETCTSP